MHHLIMLGKLIPSLDFSTCKTRVSLPRHTVVTGLACFGGSGAIPTENEFSIKNIETLQDDHNALTSSLQTMHFESATGLCLRLTDRVSLPFCLLRFIESVPIIVSTKCMQNPFSHIIFSSKTKH